MPFETLAYDDQLAALTAGAQTALREYDLPAAAAISPLLYVNNAVFRVETADSAFVLRLSRPDGKRPDWLRSELTWLDALNRESRLLVPRPIKTHAGNWLAVAPVDGLPAPLPAALFTWLDGRFFQPSEIALEDVKKAGRFLADLHAFAAHFTPPVDFSRPRLDWEGLLGQDSPYNPGAGAAIFTPEQVTVFDAVAARVKITLDQLGQSAENFGLIHGDFIAKNVLFTADGQVGAIDFDDCAWGYYLYDLAPPLLQFKDTPRYAELRAALLAGYTSVRSLPAGGENALETCIAARYLASCRWLASNLHNPRIRERAPELLAFRAAELRRFLDSGTISGQGEHF